MAEVSVRMAEGQKLRSGGVYTGTRKESTKTEREIQILKDWQRDIKKQLPSAADKPTKSSPSSVIIISHREMAQGKAVRYVRPLRLWEEAAASLAGCVAFGLCSRKNSSEYNQSSISPEPT